MRLKKNEPYKIKEGQEEQFLKDMVHSGNYCRKLHPKMIKLIMNSKLDRCLCPGVKRRRIRKKQIKKLLYDFRGDVIRTVLRHFVGFDEEGYLLD